MAKYTELNIYTKTEHIDEITATLLMEDIEGVQIIDPVQDADFLRANVNRGNYADYVEDALLEPDNNAPVIVRVYLAEGDETKLMTAKQALQNMPTVEKIEEITTESTDWENKWKEHYKPMEIGQNIVIKPTWEEYENKNKTIFTIEPGHLFGTGLHQSTQQCIEELEKHAPKANTMLDIGCGTGVLAIISLLLGTSTALAVDIEETAKQIVIENAQLNNVADRIRVHAGNIITDKTFEDMLVNTTPNGKKYKLITANIVADVIIAMLPFVKRVLNGTIIMAGIIDLREKDVKTALLNEGFEIINTNYKDNWVCISARYM